MICLKPTSNVLQCAGGKIRERHPSNGGDPAVRVLSGISFRRLLSEDNGVGQEILLKGNLVQLLVLVLPCHASSEE